jgi:hypothetical protein
MKIILVGHPGSQKVQKASEYLVNKYMPNFDVYWMNYSGEINGWAEYVAGFLRTLPDKYIIFGLDDYLLAGPLDTESFQLLLNSMDDDYVCARLCDSSFYKNKEIEGELIKIKYDDYTCTTQYCIWDREALINILEQVNTPWEFELDGSLFMTRIDYFTLGTVTPALEYNTNSSLSNRWEGVDLKGLTEEDEKEVKKRL